MPPCAARPRDQRFCAPARSNPPEQVLEDDTLPDLARDLFRFQAREYAAVESRLEEIEAKLMK